MENLEEQLRNEGFCLLRLCADLSNFMQQGQSGKTYLNETKGFLDYITATMQSVDEFVREVVDNPPESELIKIKLKDFGVIKN